MTQFLQRLGIGVGWTTLVAAEMVAASRGLGFMVLNAAQFLASDEKGQLAVWNAAAEELFGWSDRAGTRWKFSAIPLGGYVKMRGDADATSTTIDIKALPDPEGFPSKTVWQRMAVVAAGPFANFLFAIVVLAVLFAAVGRPFTPPEVGEVQPESAAAEAGLQPGDLIIVAGRPSMGKTAFALNIAEHVALHPSVRLPVAVFSMEMSGAQLALRMIGSVGRVDQHELRTGTFKEDDWSHLIEAVGKLNDAHIYVDDSAGLNALELRSRARRLHRQCAEVGGLALIVVDYLQLMQVTGTAENRATDPRSFIHIMSSFPGTENWFYVDDDDVAALRLAHRPAPAERSPDPEHVTRPQPLESACHPADDADRVVQLLRLVGIGDDRDRDLADAEGVHHVELTRLEAVGAARRGIGEPQPERVDAIGLLDLLDDLGALDLIGVQHGSPLAPAFPGGDGPVSARTSSVMSMPTGHQVMQRPQPTQPDIPNWSIHAATLCVSHMRYRSLTVGRRFFPWM